MAIREIKCPNCGGYMHFSPDEGNVKCEFCDSVFTADVLENYAEIITEECNDEQEYTFFDDKYIKENATVYTCSSCGGEIITDDVRFASRCPYCDSPVLMTSRVEGVLRPEYIIPFKITKEQAQEAYKNFCRHRPLLPKMFLSENRIDSITGLYAPFWLFDCDCGISARFKATRTHSWSTADFDYTRTDHFCIYRAGDMSFSAVPVDGSSKLDNKFSEAVEPYDISKAVSFNSAYLLGFVADKYDENSEHASKRAFDRVKHSAEAAAYRTVSGYGTVINEHSGVHIRSSKSHYALLPIWLLNTSYKNKIYSFAMNGQTGKIVGELPISVGKGVGLFAGLTALLTVLFSVIGILFL